MSEMKSLTSLQGHVCYHNNINVSKYDVNNTFNWFIYLYLFPSLNNILYYHRNSNDFKSEGKWENQYLKMLIIIYLLIIHFISFHHQYHLHRLFHQMYENIN